MVEILKIRDKMSCKSELAKIAIAFLVLIGIANAIELDNDGGGLWQEYMHFPLTSTISEYAVYKIVIDGSTWTVYNATGSVEVSTSYDGFWSKVQSDGDDIRAFNQDEQLYFWVEEFDYTNQTAVIWVNLTTGSSELNIAYGNSAATKSAYENPEQTLTFFDDFEDYTTNDPTELGKWAIVSGSPTITTVSVGKVLELYDTDTADELNTDTWAIPYIVEYKVYYEVADIETAGYLGIGDWLSGTYVIGINPGFPDSNYWGYKYSGSGTTGSCSWHASSVSTQYSTWEEIKFIKTSSSIKVYAHNELIIEQSDTATQTKFGFRSPPSAKQLLIDNVYVYKYADPADFGTPSVQTFGETSFSITSKTPGESSITRWSTDNTISFCVNLSDSGDVYWYLDSSLIKSELNVTNSSVTIAFSVGEHSVIVYATNGTATISTSWNIEIVNFTIPVSPVVDSNHLILWLRFDLKNAEDSSGNDPSISANGSYVAGRYGFGFSGSLDINISKPTSYTLVYWLKEGDDWHFYAFTNVAEYRDLVSGDYMEHFSWNTELNFTDVIIDDIKAYNTTLSFAQIKQMYEVLRVKFYDESTNEKIKANATIFNANYSINLQTDSVTKEAVLFHADVPETGEYWLKVLQNGIYRQVLVNITDALTEITMYFPSKNIVQVVFQLVDYTGQFSSDAILALKKLLNSSLVKIHEEQFDAFKEANSYLIAGERYQICVRNSVEERTIGWFTPYASGTKLIEIRNPSLEQPMASEVTWDFSFNSSNNAISFVYNDVLDQTEYVKFWVYDMKGSLLYLSLIHI